MFRNLLISSFDATIRVKRAFHPTLASRGFASHVFLVYIYISLKMSAMLPSISEKQSDRAQSFVLTFTRLLASTLPAPLLSSHVLNLPYASDYSRGSCSLLYTPLSSVSCSKNVHINNITSLRPFIIIDSFKPGFH